ncbi:MAG: CBS domain-containing protein [Halobacteriota archaeon]|nr:CBS domain-containing protein [Halobacteriota archaeon]
MIVEEIMKKEVFTIGPEAKISEAARIMSDEMIGYIIVQKDGDLLGILTERDIISEVVAEERSPGEMKVKELMSSPVITVDPKISIKEAVETMTKNVIRRLPVIDGDELVGIITSGDISSILPSFDSGISKEIQSILSSINNLMKEKERRKKDKEVDEKTRHYIG